MSSTQLILWAVTFAMLLFVFPAMVILLLIGLFPTLVAYFVDRTPKKYATFTVGALNVTGVFPSARELWNAGIDFPDLIAIITNIFDMAIMYAAAGFGWMLYLLIPPIVASVITVVAQHRIAQLRAQQRELIEVWGHAITMPAEEDGL